MSDKIHVSAYLTVDYFFSRKHAHENCRQLILWIITFIVFNTGSGKICGILNALFKSCERHKLNSIHPQNLDKKAPKLSAWTDATTVD